MANTRTDSDAVIKLVINGQQANASLKELTDTQRKLNSELRNMKPADPGYGKILEQVTAVNRATSELRLQQRGLDGEVKKLKASWSDLATVAGGNLIADGIQMAISAATDFISGSKAAYAESEQGSAQLQAVLKSTGGVAGQTKEQLDDLAASIMNLTGVDDDVITKSESLLLTFTNVRGEIFDKTLPAIVDMTAALNNGNVSMETIQATTLQVGKALNDPIKGMTALRKVGVSFTEDQIKTVKTMVATNDVAGAQKIILAELSKEFGGVGEALASTETGAAQKFNTRIGNIQESLGKMLTGGKSMMVEFLSPFVGWLERATATNLSDTLEKDRIALAGNIVQLQASNTSHETRVGIIKKLKEQYPDYLKNINAEKTSNMELIPVLNSINQALIVRIAFQKKTEEVTKTATDAADAFTKLDAASGKFAQTIGNIMDQANSKGLNIVMPKNLTDIQQADFLIRKLNETASQGKGLNISQSIKDLQISKQTISGFKQVYDDAASASQKAIDKQVEFGKKYKVGDDNKPTPTPPPPGGGGGSGRADAVAKAKKYAAETLKINEDLNKEMEKLGVDQLQSTMATNQKELDEEKRKYDTLISAKEAYLKRDGLSPEQKKSATADVAKLQADKTTALNAMAAKQEADMMDKIAALRAQLTGKIETELEKEKALINKSYDDQEAAFQGNQPRLDQLKLERTKDLTDAELREKQRLEKEKQRLDAEYALLTGDKNNTALAAINKKYDDELAALKDSFSKKLVAEQEFKDAEAKIQRNRDAEIAKSKEEQKAADDALQNDEEQKKKDAIIASAQSVSDAVFTILSNNRQRETDMALTAIEKQRDKELNNKRLTEKQKAAINKKYDDEAKAVKLKAWKDEKAASIAQAVINGALTVTKILSQTGVFSPPALIAAGIATAAQIAIIVSQKPPEFAKGVRNFEGGPALVGEEGMEAIEENGKLWLTTKPTIANLAPGANVYTADETAKMMNVSLGEKLYQPSNYSIDNATARKAEMNYRSPVSVPSFPAVSSSSTENSKVPAQSDELKIMQKTLADFMSKQSDINERPVVLNYKAIEEKKKEVDQVRLQQGM